ncbi:MAG: ribosomal protein S18 acetylase RimI-like enzyme [Dokdonia sp.]|jgi:ribosomal protein S18 acetylase RimI-like enzyme
MRKAEIRIATVDDATHISVLGQRTFSETFGHLFTDKQDLLHYVEITFSVPKITASLHKLSNVFWIAFVDEKPIGYAKLKLDSPTEFVDVTAICQLQKIYVLKEFLSLKIGSELQERLLDKARALSYEYIWLSVLHSNDRAIQFYEKNGFDLIGNHNFTIGQEHFDFFAMGKKLNQ